MSTKDQRCYDDEYWDFTLSRSQSCHILCPDSNPVDCRKFCPHCYEKYYGSGSTITTATTPEHEKYYGSGSTITTATTLEHEKYYGSGSTITPTTTPEPLVTIGSHNIAPAALAMALAFTLGMSLVVVVVVVVLCLRRKMKHTSARLHLKDAEGNSGRARFSHSSTVGATIKLLSEPEQHPDQTYNLAYRTNQGTASGGPPNLGELAQNPGSDHVVLPTSRPGDFGMSQDPTPTNPLSSLRESRGLIQNPVRASSEPPSDIPGSGIPSLHVQVYGAFPPEVADRWNDLSLHSDQEGNLNLVSGEEDRDPLSGDPGSLQLDLRSGIERAPQPQAAANVDHWEVVEQMSGTGGVSTAILVHGFERIKEHAIHMPWLMACYMRGHKLEIRTNLGFMAKEKVKQKILDISGLPRQALVLRHRCLPNPPAPGSGPYPPEDSIDSLFGDSGPA